LLDTYKKGSDENIRAFCFLFAELIVVAKNKKAPVKGLSYLRSFKL